MADDGRAVFDDSAASADDLIGMFLARGVGFRFEVMQVGGDVDTEGFHIRAQIGEIVLCGIGVPWQEPV